MVVKIEAMKKIISKLIFATVVALGLISCEKTDPNLKKIAGEWYLQEENVEVYINFNADGTFELYQNISVNEGMNAPRYRLYSGTFTYDGTLLTGVYSDKSQWAYTYQATVSGDNLTMAFTDNGKEFVRTYVRKSIPFSVRKNCTEPLKSAADEVVPFL
jgi:hypothetical protein